MQTDPTQFAAYSWMWRKAFVQATVATLLCVLVLSIVFLPGEIARLNTRPKKRPVDCVLLPDGKSLLSLVEVAVKEQRSTSLLWHDLSLPTPNSRLVRTKMNPECLALDPLGRTVFVGDASGVVLCGDLRKGLMPDAAVWKVRKISPTSLACSPDGSTLLASNRYGLYAWNTQPSEMDQDTPRWFLDDPWIESYVISPDSKSVLFSHTYDDQSELYEADMQTGESHQVFPKIHKRLHWLMISKDGLYLACVDDGSGVSLLERSSTREPWTLCSFPELCTGTNQVACFTPQSDLLITSDRNCHQLVAWDLKRKKIRTLFDQHPTRIVGCNMLNETEIISWCFDDILRLWNLEQPGPIRQIKL